MEMVYLGLFERIFNQVLDRILMPVFDFIVSVMNIGFAFIFNDVLSGVLLPLLEIAFEKYMIAFNFIYGIFSYEFCIKPCFSILDTVERAFDLFIGLENVVYYPNGTSSPAITDKTLLEVLISFPAVQNAFWLIMVSGIGIALLLSIYGVARSAFDLDFENKRPVSHVMSQLFKSIVGAFLIPFMVILVINLANVVLKTLDSTINAGNSQSESLDNSTMGSSLFVMCTVNAAWDNSINRATRRIQGTGHGIKMEVYDEINEDFKLDSFPRNKFLANDKTYNYRNSLIVWRYFNPAKFDYLGFYTGIFVMVILLICVITLIKRLLELVILYLVSPYFVAMMPIDDGEKFRQWFSMFLGKLVTGYGSLVALKVYLMLMPMFMRGGFSMPNSSVTTGDLMYYIFVIGGAWSVYKSSSLLTNMVNASAARSEEQSMAGGAGAMALAVSPVRNVAMSIKGRVQTKLVDENLAKAKSEISKSFKSYASKETEKGIYNKGYQKKMKKIEKEKEKEKSQAAKSTDSKKKSSGDSKKAARDANKADIPPMSKESGGKAETPPISQKPESSSKEEKTGNKIDIPPISQGVGSGSGEEERGNKINIPPISQGVGSGSGEEETGNKIDIPPISQGIGNNSGEEESGNKIDIPPISQGVGSGSGEEETGNKIDIPPISQESGSSTGTGGGDTAGSPVSQGHESSAASPKASNSAVSDPAAKLREKLSESRVGQKNDEGGKK